MISLWREHHMMNQIFLNLLFITLNSVLKSELREAQGEQQYLYLRTSRLNKHLHWPQEGLNRQLFPPAWFLTKNQTKAELNKAHLSAGAALPFCSTRKQDKGSSVNLMAPFYAKCWACLCVDPSCFRHLLLLHCTFPRGLSVAFPSLNISTAVILLHLKDNAVQQGLCLEGNETLVLSVQKS